MHAPGRYANLRRIRSLDPEVDHDEILRLTARLEFPWDYVQGTGIAFMRDYGVPSIAELLDLARPLFALYVGGMGARGKNFYNDVAKSYGYEKEAEEIQDLYLSGKKKEAEALIPTDWLEAANLVGPASYVKERIAAFQEAGVTDLNITPVSEDPAATVAQVREWVS